MREIIIFVHGVSSDQLGRRHDPEYDSLYEGVAAVATQSSPWRTAEVCRVEWGWNHDAAAQPCGEQALTLAQTTLGERLLGVINDAYDPTINPGRFVVNAFRPLLVRGRRLAGKTGWGREQAGRTSGAPVGREGSAPPTTPQERLSVDAPPAVVAGYRAYPPVVAPGQERAAPPG